MSNILIVTGNCRQGHVSDRLAMQIETFKSAGHKVTVKTQAELKLDNQDTDSVVWYSIDECDGITKSQLDAAYKKICRDQSMVVGNPMSYSMHDVNFEPIRYIKPDKNWERKGRFPVTRKVKK